MSEKEYTLRAKCSIKGEANMTFIRNKLIADFNVAVVEGKVEANSGVIRIAEMPPYQPISTEDKF